MSDTPTSPVVAGGIGLLVGAVLGAIFGRSESRDNPAIRSGTSTAELQQEVASLMAEHGAGRLPYTRYSESEPSGDLVVTGLGVGKAVRSKAALKKSLKDIGSVMGYGLRVVSDDHFEMPNQEPNIY